MYEADITWTTHGVPHITAADWASLGFGQGWACARDHFAAIVDHAVKVRSQRSRFLGRGEHDRHLHTDFGYLALGITQRAQAVASTQPVEIRDLVDGYRAGCNAWFEEHGRGALPEWCRDAPWIGPLEPLDLWRVYADLAIVASGRNLVEYIGSAVPPGGPVEEPISPPPPEPLTADPGLASNAWALGRAVTANGRGMVMANPHFPWWGEGRFWECHLRIPGTLDVYGVSLVGTPLVQMGFNRHVAWAHTFSRGHRFIVYKLDLVPDRPTTYRYGDDEREMAQTTVAVDVLGESGEITPVERTLWSTHHGPMLNLPMLGWNEAVGFTYRDANIDNDRFLAQELAMDTADSMDAFQSAIATHQGLPWVNTLAADETGRCWYADASSAPNLSDEAQKAFVANIREDPITALAFSLRVALLDGSDPRFEWQDDPAAPEPGLVAYADLPKIERDDYLFNANDPYWLPHAQAQISEHTPFCGLYHDPISARTRTNAMLLRELSEASARSVTPDDVTAALMSNRSMLAELLVDDIVARLRASDLEHQAGILESWDRRYDNHSVGAVLFREFLASFSERDRSEAGPLFAHGFDPARPVDTPYGLAPAPEGRPDPVATAMLAALDALARAGIPPDAALGDVQYAERGGQRWPIHGGYEVEGVANVIAPLGTLARADLEPGPHLPDPVPGRTELTGIRVGGYPAVYGVSFVMVLSFGDAGPEGSGLLVYSQSGDPESPHHSDQIGDWSTKRLRPLLFTDEAIAADPNRSSRAVRG